MAFRFGQRIWIACDVKPGMSPEERPYALNCQLPIRGSWRGLSLNDS